jgi:hypothetical protein
VQCREEDGHPDEDYQDDRPQVVSHQLHKVVKRGPNLRQRGREALGDSPGMESQLSGAVRKLEGKVRRLGKPRVPHGGGIVASAY